jgi:hypothetical protein
MPSDLRLHHVSRNSILQITPRRMIIHIRERPIVPPKDPVTNALFRKYRLLPAVEAGSGADLIIVLGAGQDAILEGADVIEFLENLGLTTAGVGVEDVGLAIEGEDAVGGVYDIGIIGDGINRCECFVGWAGSLGGTGG